MAQRTIIAEFDRYISREISLEEFEEWVFAHLQEFLDSGDEALIQLTDKTDVLLMELRDGVITDSQFLEAMEALIRAFETQYCTFSAQPGIPLQSASDAETIHKAMIATELVSELHHPRVVFA